MEENLCFEPEKMNDFWTELLDIIRPKFTDDNVSLSKHYKEDNSFYTDLDVEIQDEILSFIDKKFNLHNYIVEEGGTKFINNQSIYTWVIDPIDGTANFAENKKEFSVSVGLMKNNDFISALVYFPKLKKTLISTLNEPFFLNGKKQKNKSSISNLIFCTKSINRYEILLDQNRYLSQCHRCATYSLLEVLEGDALFFYIENTNIYDIGPMAFILKQAGFKLINKDVEEFNFTASADKIPSFIACQNTNVFDWKLLQV